MHLRQEMYKKTHLNCFVKWHIMIQDDCSFINIQILTLSNKLALYEAGKQLNSDAASIELVGKCFYVDVQFTIFPIYIVLFPSNATLVSSVHTPFSQ